MTDHRLYIFSAARLLVSFVLLLLLGLAAATAQTLTPLHSFHGGGDGANPVSGLTMDAAGNLYGTTSEGGYMGGSCWNVGGCGTVFRLSPRNGAWIFTTLYEFQGGEDGESPQAAVTIGPDGAIYGTTVYGGAFGCSLGYGCGIVFKLTPGASICHTSQCHWTETIIYDFAEEGPNGTSTPYGGVIFDDAGNLYGTTFAGGVGICARACGVVYKLSQSNGAWTLTPLYDFTGGDDGASPMSTLFRDAHGNLYGTTAYGGNEQYGTVFELKPTGSAWKLESLYSFHGQSDGSTPTAGLVMDSHGNLYGDDSFGGINYGGVVFELSPNGTTWNFEVIDNPVGDLAAPLNLDNAGNLYGTSVGGGSDRMGVIFELSPSGSGWIEQDLYSFSGVDGALPYSSVIFDGSGRMFGTTNAGGAGQSGVVWEFTR
jgi:uncharacterized repeat protein (TIGR03803 family)